MKFNFNISKKLTLSLLFCLMGLTLSCKPEIRLKLQEPASLPSPVFLILPASGNSQTQEFYHLYIETAQKQNVWEIKGPVDRQNQNLTQITYGIAPPGFDTIIQAQPLQAGQSYRLSVYGVGVGSLEFGVSETGDINEL